MLHCPLWFILEAKRCAGTAVCFYTFTFVIDQDRYPTCTKALLDGKSPTTPHIPFFGQEGVERHAYLEDGKLELIVGSVIHVMAVALLLRNMCR